MNPFGKALLRLRWVLLFLTFVPSLWAQSIGVEKPSKYDFGIDWSKEFGRENREKVSRESFSFEVDRNFGEHAEKAREFSKSLDGFSEFLNLIEREQRGRVAESDLWELMGFVYSPLITFSGPGLASGTTGAPLTVGGRVGQGVSVAPTIGGLQLGQVGPLVRYKDGTVDLLANSSLRTCTWIENGELKPDTKIGLSTETGECTTDFRDLQRPQLGPLSVEYVDRPLRVEADSKVAKEVLVEKVPTKAAAPEAVGLSKEVIREYCHGLSEAPSRAIEGVRQTIEFAEKSVGALKGNSEDQKEIGQLARRIAGLMLGATVLISVPPEHIDEETKEQWNRQRDLVINNIRTTVGAAVQDFRGLSKEQQARLLAKSLGQLVGDFASGAVISKGFIAISKALTPIGVVGRGKAAEEVAQVVGDAAQIQGARSSYVAIASLAKDVGVQVGGVKILKRWKGADLNGVVGRYLDKYSKPYMPWRPAAVVYELELTENSKWIRFVGEGNPSGRWVAREKLVNELKQIKLKAIKEGLSEVKMIEAAKEKVKDMLGLPGDFTHVADVNAKSGLRVLVGEANEMKSASGVLRPGGEMQYELLDTRSPLLEWPAAKDLQSFERFMLEMIE